MGLTRTSLTAEIGRGANYTDKHDCVVALAGNPNVGKSTVFNALTGMHQHTGNWSGKTVGTAFGRYTYDERTYSVVDLPGTYSLLTHSKEEDAAKDFLVNETPHLTVVVSDAACLERNLNLVLQILEVTPKVLLCVNLIDEAKKRHIKIDIGKLKKHLGIPVIAITARSKKDIERLKEEITRATDNPSESAYTVQYDDEIEKAITTLREGGVGTRFEALRLLDGTPEAGGDSVPSGAADAVAALQIARTAAELSDEIAKALVKTAEFIAKEVVFVEKATDMRREKIDRVLTGRIFAYPVMLLLLLLIFWITIVGANYPSSFLSNLFSSFEMPICRFLQRLGVPQFFTEMLVFGMYRVLYWVVSVMLPPMAIFFPLFTLLEDVGYLPRIAYNLDRCFHKCSTCGKQALTMCMGFGCNAAGVVGCRIIDSPRERLIAILTNNFVPCNGRFPLLIAMTSMFFISADTAASSFWGAAFLAAIIIFSVMITLFVSSLLSKTLLRGVPSSFTLELPPYRRPQILSVLVRSLLDRTIFVLGRAVAVAAPAGIVIWLLANINVGDASLFAHLTDLLNPLGKIMGMDGVILLAFILGFPANETVIPIMMMGYMAEGTIKGYESLSALKTLLEANGWTWVTALTVVLFSLMHWPCSTTLWTIKKESGSLKWTAVAFLLPTVIGAITCILVNFVFGFTL
ncbi:MAG: ferrous iron transport protein B [Clostridia bacterium]|nr:ferrous iron transport protein B [Clostridia bacterium]